MISCQKRVVNYEKIEVDKHSEDSWTYIVEKTHKDKFRWMTNRQMGSLGYLLHDDVYYIHSNWWKENKEEVLKNIESGKLVNKKIQVEESETRVVGNTAIVTGKGIFKASLDDKPIEINLLYTEVYVLSTGKVLLLSRHACRL